MCEEINCTRERERERERSLWENVIRREGMFLRDFSKG